MAVLLGAQDCWFNSIFWMSTQNIGFGCATRVVSLTILLSRVWLSHKKYSPPYQVFSVWTNPCPNTNVPQVTTLKTSNKNMENLYNWRYNFCKNVENIVTKGEIYCFKQFRHVSKCFQKSSAADASIGGKWLNTKCSVGLPLPVPMPCNQSNTDRQLCRGWPSRRGISLSVTGLKSPCTWTPREGTRAPWQNDRGTSGTVIYCICGWFLK